MGPFSDAAALIGIHVRPLRNQGHQNNFYIEQERPVVDIIQVAFESPLHFFERISFAAVPVNLRPASDAGPYVVPA
jgi:hypothetical protein